MEQINEFSQQFTSAFKKSFEQTYGWVTKVGQEAQGMMQEQMEQSRQLVDLGIKTQTAVIQQMMQNSTTMRDMWTDTCKNFTNFVTTTTKTNH